MNEKPCEDCGEPTANEKRCRECDIEHLMADWPKCDGCGVSLYSDFVRGSGIPEKHADGCAHAARDAIARDYRVAEFDNLSKMRGELRQKLHDARRYASELVALIDEIDASIEQGRPFRDHMERRQSESSSNDTTAAREGSQERER